MEIKMVVAGIHFFTHVGLYAFWKVKLWRVCSPDGTQFGPIGTAVMSFTQIY